jgi:putative FmdB family regulatory protein
MPIYEYKCENEHVFDMMQRMSEDPLTECVECDAPVRKILHPVGISFKGSGFYSTDYNKKDPKPESKEKAESTSSTETSNGSNGAAKKETSTSGTTEKQDQSSS